MDSCAERRTEIGRHAFELRHILIVFYRDSIEPGARLYGILAGRAALGISLRYFVPCEPMSREYIDGRNHGRTRVRPSVGQVSAKSLESHPCRLCPHRVSGRRADPGEPRRQTIGNVA